VGGDAELRWLVLLDSVASLTPPWWWGRRLAGACRWRRGGASGGVGLLPRRCRGEEKRATDLVSRTCGRRGVDSSVSLH
jgi:hypothetical protein